MMGKTYTAANGQVVTDEMIDTWCESWSRAQTWRKSVLRSVAANPDVTPS